MEVIKRGDIFMADLGFNNEAGSEQQGKRPVVIIQNDIGNIYSPTVIVASITSQISKKQLPVHVDTYNYYLEKNSTIMLEQIRTLDKKKIGRKIGELDFMELNALDKALKISIGL